MSRFIVLLERLSRIAADHSAALPKVEASVYPRQCLVEAEALLRRAARMYRDVEVPAAEKEMAVTRAMLLLAEAGLLIADDV